MGPLANAQSGQTNERTPFIIDQAVEVPGAVLQPGSYVIRRKNPPPPGNSLPASNILEILNAAETQVYATITSVPEYEPPPAGRPAFTFYQSKPGLPRVIRAWWPAPHPYSYQEQFAYPRAQAAELLRTGQRVLLLPSDTISAESAAVTSSPLRDSTPLPKTAGELPILVLTGVLSLLVGLMIRFFSLWVGMACPVTTSQMPQGSMRPPQSSPVLRAARSLLSGAPVTLRLTIRL
jgi:hypothetical protein